MALLCGVLPDATVVLPSAGGSRSPEVKYFSSFCDTKPFASPGIPKLAVCPRKLRTRTLMIQASGSYDGDHIPFAPLQMESPVGQLLAQILQTQPYLHLAKAEKELENLRSQRDHDRKTFPPNSLYKRIAEVKENDRRKILEEILYCLVVQKFVENNISMIPKLATASESAGTVYFFHPDEEHEWEALHSPEAFEMIISHLSLVLGDGATKPPDTIIQMSKIKLGKLYAASIMYGYFLRRVDERYQLERSTNTLPKDFDEGPSRYGVPTQGMQLWDPDSLIRIYPDGDYGGLGSIGDSGSGGKSYKLRTYVMSMDEERLQQFATMRSKEAKSLIEKQTQALFGSPDIIVNDDGTLDTSNDELVSLTFLGLQMLILEAVAFGSFLLNAESFTESKYPFTTS